MNLQNLDQVREEMVSEINNDIKNEKLYISERLNQRGQMEYPKILLESAKSKNINYFIQSLGIHYFNTHFIRRKPKGGYSRVVMPKNANASLCEGEFNRFYIRGVCLKAISSGQRYVTAYRARYSNNPRLESLLIEGKQFDAEKLLKDLRMYIGVDTSLGLPPGPNSGMSVKI